MKFKPKYLGSLSSVNNIELLKQFCQNEDLLGTKYHQAKFIQLKSTLSALIEDCKAIRENINECENNFSLKMTAS